MTRVASGVLLGTVFFALLWFTNATVLLVVALGVAALAVHEFVQLFRTAGARIAAVPTLAATWAATILVPFPHVAVEVGLALGMILIAVWTMAALSSAGAGDAAQPRLAGTPHGVREAALGAAAAVLATVYLGVGLGTLVACYVYGGRGAVVLLIVTIVVSDSAQYYTGRAVGRRPLAPRISPKKTLEGAAGGFVVGPLVLVGLAYELLPAATDQLALALLGLALVAAGIAGDLFESMLKRAAALKDSSALIPGHGGVLDRIDALLFAGPVFYGYLLWLFA